MVEIPDSGESKKMDKKHQDDSSESLLASEQAADIRIAKSDLIAYFEEDFPRATDDETIVFVELLNHIDDPEILEMLVGNFSDEDFLSSINSPEDWITELANEFADDELVTFPSISEHYPVIIRDRSLQELSWNDMVEEAGGRREQREMDEQPFNEQALSLLTSLVPHFNPDTTDGRALLDSVKAVLIEGYAYQDMYVGDNGIGYRFSGDDGTERYVWKAGVITNSLPGRPERQPDEALSRAALIESLLAEVDPEDSLADLYYDYLNQDISDSKSGDVEFMTFEEYKAHDEEMKAYAEEDSFGSLLDEARNERVEEED